MTDKKQPPRVPLKRAIRDIDGELRRRGWRWAQLARMLGASDQQAYNWRKRGLPYDRVAPVAAAFGWPVGRLLAEVSPAKSAPHMTTATPSTPPGAPAAIRNCPLLPWQYIREWKTRMEELAAQARELFPCISVCGPRTFVVRIDALREAPPRLVAGDLVFVDPDAPVESERIVAVTLDDGTAGLRQIIIDGERAYLRSLDARAPDEIVPVSEIGRVVAGVAMFASRAL